MNRAGLIRLGGLAAMVGGAAYAVQGLLVPPLVRLLVGYAVSRAGVRAPERPSRMR
jgi:hypothetical protein